MKRAMEWMKTHHGNLPTVKQIWECSRRNLDLTQEDNHEIIIYWLDYHLPKVSGLGHEFKEKIRHYEPVSQAKTNKKGALFDITAESEAFGLLVLENNYSKWKEIYRISTRKIRRQKAKSIRVTTKRADPSKKKTAKKHKKEKEEYLVCELDNEELKTVYTKPNSGQEKWGGWSAAGKNRYITFWKGIHKSRQRDRCEEFEKMLYPLLKNIMESPKILMRNSAKKMVLERIRKMAMMLKKRRRWTRLNYPKIGRRFGGS